jgi:dihydrofolate reductase
MALKIIVAVAENKVIGQKNGLPFRLAADMKRFKEKTVGHPVISGSTTYFSLPEKFRPLPDRENIVLTRNPEKLMAEKVTVSSGFAQIVERSAREDLWVIGGAEVYRQALPLAQELHITRVLAKVEGDVLFPEWDKAEWMLISSEQHSQDEKNEYPFVWEVYRRKQAGT